MRNLSSKRLTPKPILAVVLSAISLSACSPGKPRTASGAPGENKASATSLPGFPISTGGNGDGAMLSERLAIDRLNQRLYAINRNSNSVSAYSINPTTGALTPLPFSPIPVNSGGHLLSSVAIHKSGSPLVIADPDGTQMFSYQITATTATVAAGSPYTTLGHGNSVKPFSIAFSQDGNYVYGGQTSYNPINTFSPQVAGYSVSPHRHQHQRQLKLQRRLPTPTPSATPTPTPAPGADLFNGPRPGRLLRKS